jgi:hypothetical protein
VSIVRDEDGAVKRSLPAVGLRRPDWPIG